jgi:uncharacterized glyoxalase superfamily protein PhnB
MTDTTHAPIIPTLRYRDAAAAIDWLCEAFGFERHMVVAGEGDTVAHCQLTYCGGMIMLGSALDDDYGWLQRPPVSGLNTQSPYVVVPDADPHFDRAKATGAEIVTDIADASHGGRAYSCRDPEGNLGHFGTYDPFADA